MVDQDEGWLVIQVGRNIAARRKQLDLKQDQLAEAIGVEPESVSRFERATHAPALRTLERVAAVLAIQPYELLKGERPAPPEDAELVQSYLMSLTKENRAFVLSAMRDLCFHLASTQAQIV